jgi:hypothetical protein
MLDGVHFFESGAALILHAGAEGAAVTNLDTKLGRPKPAFLVRMLLSFQRPRCLWRRELRQEGHAQEPETGPEADAAV